MERESEELALAFEHLVQDYTGVKTLRADLFRHCPDIYISKSEKLKEAKDLGYVIACLDIALENLKKKYGEKDKANRDLVQQCIDRLSATPTYKNVYNIIKTLKENKIVF
ncbi:MAG: hypothetical protein IJ180_02655 [Bacteroidales bacterium]|nr:hypothetical protein [Bacteroidales bacterium]